MADDADDGAVDEPEASVSAAESLEVLAVPVPLAEDDVEESEE